MTMKYDTAISTKKTKTMKISKKPFRCKSEVGHVIDQVMDFCYLGIDISTDMKNAYKDEENR